MRSAYHDGGDAPCMSNFVSVGGFEEMSKFPGTVLPVSLACSYLRYVYIEEVRHGMV